MKPNEWPPLSVCAVGGDQNYEKCSGCLRRENWRSGARFLCEAHKPVGSVDLPALGMAWLDEGDGQMNTGRWSSEGQPAAKSLRAFKFIAEQTPVPNVGVYSRCATVVIEETEEKARQALKAWAARQNPPDDVLWIDYCPVVEVPVEPGAVLLFVML